MASITINRDCLRSKNGRSSCQRCIDSCLYQALSVHHEKIVVDAQRCISCGGCIFSCPTEAIEGTLPERRTKDDCLYSHALPLPSFKELMLYYASGIRRLHITDGHIGWQAAAEEVNQALILLEKQPIVIEIGHRQQDNILQSRRSLLRFGQIKQQFSQNKIHNSPLYPLFPGYHIFDLQLDREKCTLCQGCERSCPTRCIQFNERAISVNTAYCSGCERCQDLCPEKAIKITKRIGIAKTQHYPRYQYQCSLCQQSYSSVWTEVADCPACRLRRSLKLPYFSIGGKNNP